MNIQELEEAYFFQAPYLDDLYDAELSEIERDGITEHQSITNGDYDVF